MSVISKYLFKVANKGISVFEAIVTPNTLPPLIMPIIIVQIPKVKASIPTPLIFPFNTVKSPIIDIIVKTNPYPESPKQKEKNKG